MRDVPGHIAHRIKEVSGVFFCRKIVSIQPNRLPIDNHISEIEKNNAGRHMNALSFIFGSALLCFKAWVSLVDDIGPATTANDLAVTVTRLECFDRGFHFHGFGPDVRIVFTKARDIHIRPA